MPIGVPGLTEILPVAVSKVRPAGTVAPGARLMVTVLVVAATPLRVSPVSTFSTLVAPDAPLIPATLSLIAAIGPAMTDTKVGA